MLQLRNLLIVCFLSVTASCYSVDASALSSDDITIRVRAWQAVARQMECGMRTASDCLRLCQTHIATKVTEGANFLLEAMVIKDAGQAEAAIPLLQ